LVRKEGEACVQKEKRRGYALENFDEPKAAALIEKYPEKREGEKKGGKQEEKAEKKGNRSRVKLTGGRTFSLGREAREEEKGKKSSNLPKGGSQPQEGLPFSSARNDFREKGKGHPR